MLQPAQPETFHEPPAMEHGKEDTYPLGDELGCCAGDVDLSADGRLVLDGGESAAPAAATAKAVNRQGLRPTPREPKKRRRLTQTAGGPSFARQQIGLASAGQVGLFDVLLQFALDAPVVGRLHRLLAPFRLQTEFRSVFFAHTRFRQHLPALIE